MNKLLFIIPIIIVGGIVAYAVSPYFTESTINEELPAGAIIQEDDGMMENEMMDDGMMENEMMEGETLTESMTEEVEVDSDEMKAEDEMTTGSSEMEGEMMENEMIKETEFEDEMMEGVENKAGEMTEGEMTGETIEQAMEEEITIEESMEGAMEESTMTRVTYSGTFIGVGDGIHHAEGNAFTVPLEDGGNVLRLEDFSATNGPGLYVYLSTDKRATDYVDLGKLKANRGDQNYEIPEGTDLTKYNKVLIWCDPFSVLFGSAEILPGQ